MEGVTNKEGVTNNEDNLILSDVAEVQSFGVFMAESASPVAPLRTENATPISPLKTDDNVGGSEPGIESEGNGSAAASKYTSEGASEGISVASKIASIPVKQPSPEPFTPNERMKAGIARTRAAMAMNALRAKAEKRSSVAEHSEFLDTKSVAAGRLTEQQVQLLSKLKGLVQSRITLASNYRGMLGFALYIGLYFFAAYTQRDTSKTYDIEQALLKQFVEPMTQGGGSRGSFFDYVRTAVLPIFEDATCGNGMCEPPGEYPLLNGHIGCSDCGVSSEATEIVVYLQDTRVPQGQSRGDDSFLSWMDNAGLEPTYSWNVYSDNVQDWLFETNMPIVGGAASAVQFRVPDGNVTVRIFQEKQLYVTEYSAALLAQFGPADPTTALPQPAFQGQNYGHITEAIAWTVGAKTQYTFQEDAQASTNPAELNILGNEGLLQPISGVVYVADEQGQMVPEMLVSSCSWTPEDMQQFLSSTHCPFGNITDRCWNYTAMAEVWSCPDRWTFEILRHTDPGGKPPPVKPSVVPPRYISSSNKLVGAVVLSQKRFAEGECHVTCDQACQSTREKILGTMASSSTCKQGRSLAPFGVDPTFLPSSSLYDGRVDPSEWYYPGEFSGPNVPYGFFPYSYLHPDSHSDNFNLYLDARMTTAQAKRAVDFMEQAFFIDNVTETLELAILMYNPELDAIADIILEFRISTGGAVYTGYSIVSLALIEFLEPATTIATAILTTIGAAFMMYQEFGELEDHFHRKRLLRYFTDLWNVVDWLAYISVPGSLWFFLVLAENLKRNLTIANDGGNVPYPLAHPSSTARVFEVDPEKEQLLVDIEENFRRYASFLSAYAAWTAFNVMILMFRLFKVLDFQGRLGLITRTFAKSFQDIVHFLFLFIFVLVAFAVMGQKLYGRQMDQFKDFQNCLISLVRLTFAIGDDPYHQMLRANSQLQSFTAIYYLVFFFLSSVVLVNIFLAILLEAFGNVKDNASNSESIFEGLGTLARYDGTVAQQHLLKLIKTRSLGLRFLPDEMLLKLLEAWIKSEKEQGVEIDDSFAKSFSKKKKRASWGGAKASEEEEDGSRVVELPDGSQLTSIQLSALMLSLIAGAPEKMRDREERGSDFVSRVQSALFKSSTSATSSQVAPEEENLESGTADASPTAAGSPSRRRRASAAETWWQSVRRGIAEVDGARRDGEDGGVESNPAAMLVSTQSLENRKLKTIVRSLMQRYGKDVDENQEEDKNIGFLKLEALQKELEFFERFPEFERRFEDFMAKYDSDQAQVHNLISRRSDLI